MKEHEVIRLVELLELAYADARESQHGDVAEQIDTMQASICLRYLIVQTESPGAANPTGSYAQRASIAAVEVEPADAQAYYELAEMVADSPKAEGGYQGLVKGQER